MLSVDNAWFAWANGRLLPEAERSRWEEFAPPRRHEGFLGRLLHAGSRAETEARVVRMEVAGFTVTVHEHLAEPLARVSEELRALRLTDPAVDLVPKSYGGRHAYWMWAMSKVRDFWTVPYERRWMVPAPVVEAFERNGFVWGGKWLFFDTMHFEYRPEILLMARE